MDVFIKKYNQIKFGEYVDDTFEEMILRLFIGGNIEKVDAVVGISSFAKELHGVDNFALFTKSLGNIQAENAYSFADGAEAINAVYKFVKNGVYKNVLIVGAEKVSSLKTTELESCLSTFLPHYEAEIGQTFLGRLALLQRYYIEKKGLDPKKLYEIAEKNSANGVGNKFAQFNKAFTIEQIAGSSLLAEPVRMLETTSFCDGAAMVVLSGEESEIEMTGVGYGSADDQFTFDSPAIKKALKKAKLPEEIDVIELTDITALMQYLTVTEYNSVTRGKSIENVVINASGGLKSCGHPVGATSIRQIIDVANYLKKNRKQNGSAVYLHGIGNSASITNLELKD